MFLIFIAVFLLFPLNIYADWDEDLYFSGYLEKRECRQIKSSNLLQASEILFRGELKQVNENSLLFVSADFFNNEFSDETSKLHEAYIDYTLEELNIRLGRQIIIKGNSDGFRVTDSISPVDSSEYITRSFDETRMAVDAMNLSFNKINYSLNFIFIPVFTPAEFPDKESPWFIENGFQGETKEKDVEKKLSNSEAGAFVNFYLPGLDFGFSYFRGFSDNPVSKLANIDNETVCLKNYEKEEIFGSFFSKPVKDFVLRGELAYFRGIHFNSKNDFDNPEKSCLLKWLAGFDWYPGSNITLTCQFYQELLTSKKNKTKKQNHVNIAFFKISKKFFREKLNLGSSAYINTDKTDSYFSLSADYELTSRIKIYGGTDFFSGSDTGIYGKYKDNTQMWLKAKYSF
jgi:hypothetical protein